MLRRGWAAGAGMRNWLSPVSVLLLGSLYSLPLAPELRAQVDLTQSSIEELMSVEVTSVSKKEQQLSKTGAAVFVITQEDIRRSGANNIPDLLRMVPGVDVAQVDANAWAISIRGFNFRYSSKCLVLIDGRAVYSPIFSGVFWDQQDVPLEDIDRIEVIRGPGGTIWGANAVNGVINIITKNSKETRGGLVTAGTGSQRIADSLAQYGGAAGKNGSYRVFGRYFADDGAPTAQNETQADRWHGLHGGFRSDWDLTKQDTLTVQGDYFGALEGQTTTTLLLNRLPDMAMLIDPIRVSSDNLLSRWTHTLSNGAEATLQTYYDHFRRLDGGGTASQSIGDVDFAYHFRVGSRNDMVAGGGYRIADLAQTPIYATSIGNGHRRDQLVNLFFQDEIALSPKWDLTIGTKIEHNGYTGFEMQPSAQLVFSPTKRQTLWASAARAVEQPSWYMAEARSALFTFPLQGGGFALAEAFGSLAMRAPSLADFEGGYRAEITKRTSIDVDVFRGQYYNEIELVADTPYFTTVPGPPHLLMPYNWSNNANATTYGAELFARYRVNPHWQLTSGYSYLRERTADFSGKTVLGSVVGQPGDTPKNQFQVRSTLNLPHRLEWDATAFYVSALGVGPVPSYTRVDTRVGWRAGESVEFSVGAQNLLAPRHLEFLDAVQVTPSYVERSVFGKVTWRF